MDKFISLLITAVFLSFLLSCSEEIQPLYITGSWDAYYFERVDCSDSLDNIRVDLNNDSLYLIGGNNVRFNSYTLEVLDNGNYTFTLSRNVNGQEIIQTEAGVSLSSGFNDIIFCGATCNDTLLKKGLYVISGNTLDLSYEDTIDVKCGIVFQARRID